VAAMTNNDEYQNDFLKHVTDDVELANKWREAAAKIQLSQSQFCRRFGIDASNFSKWLSQKKKSPASRNAVIKFLAENGDITFKTEQKPTVTLHSPQNEDNAIATIVNDRENIKTIVFIDADNYRDSLRDLRNLLGTIPAESDTRILLYHSPKTLHHDQLDTNYFFKFQTNTSAKDAADVAISFISGVLSTLLPNNIDFYFFTRDHFVNELRFRLESKRNVFCFDKWNVENVLSIFGVKCKYEYKRVGVLERYKDELNALSVLLKSNKTLPIQSISSKLKLQVDWLELLQQEDVQKYLNVKLLTYHVLSSNK
jgi:DNA-binding transcriptional regulator YiaG